MCGSPPKPKPVKEKPPQYLRNPWLDGLALGGVGAARSGRNALRIDLGTPGAAPSYVGLPTTQPIPQPSVGAYPLPSFFPSVGLGARSGGSGLNYARAK